MTKIKAPLFSLDAAGTLDKNITYKKKLQNNIAQKYATPGSKNPFESSPRQKDQRSIIRLITIHWQCMTAIDKLAWENAAKDARFKGTGYHYFLHLAQTNLTQYLGLVGYWSMNYNIGDKIPDLSGNSNHGTLSPIYPCDSPTLVDSFDKKQGKAILFNGLSNFLDCGNNPSLNLTGDFSIELIFSISDISTPSYIYQKDDFQVAGIIFAVGTLGFLDFYTSQLGAYQKTRSKGTPILINTLYHVVLTREGISAIIYINSIPVVLTAQNHIDPTSSILPSRIGLEFNNLYYFPGTMDDYLIFNRVLTPLEITKHYQSYNLP